MWAKEVLGQNNDTINNEVENTEKKLKGEEVKLFLSDLHWDWLQKANLESMLMKKDLATLRSLNEKWANSISYIWKYSLIWIKNFKIKVWNKIQIDYAKQYIEAIKKDFPSVNISLDLINEWENVSSPLILKNSSIQIIYNYTQKSLYSFRKNND